MLEGCVVVPGVVGGGCVWVCPLGGVVCGRLVHCIRVGRTGEANGLVLTQGCPNGPPSQMEGKDMPLGEGTYIVPCMLFREAEMFVYY